MTRAKTKKRKPTAAENKLNALLGLTTVAEKVQHNVLDSFYGISEDEIQDFREAQGLVYFLQAPALFQSKVCKHCGEPFLVSRLYVAFCSYTCIRKDLESRGFLRWEKGHDLEALANDPEVYEGNEPIWIRNPKLSQVLAILKELLENPDSTDTKLVSSLPKESEDSLSPLPPNDTPPSSSLSESGPTTPSNTTELGKPTSRGKKPSRKITFGG